MDKKPVLAVVIILGLVALGGLAGAVVLTAIDKNVPDGIWTLTAGASGALAALLTSTRYQQNDAPAPVQVMNQPNAPVPTEEAPKAAALPPSAFGQQAPVPAGPLDANLIQGYETGPADQPAADKLAVDTMGVPPGQG